MRRPSAGTTLLASAPSILAEHLERASPAAAASENIRTLERIRTACSEEYPHLERCQLVSLTPQLETDASRRSAGYHRSLRSCRCAGRSMRTPVGLVLCRRWCAIMAHLLSGLSLSVRGNARKKARGSGEYAKELSQMFAGLLPYHHVGRTHHVLWQSTASPHKCLTYGIGSAKPQFCTLITCKDEYNTTGSRALVNHIQTSIQSQLLATSRYSTCDPSPNSSFTVLYITPNAQQCKHKSISHQLRTSSPTALRTATASAHHPSPSPAPQCRCGRSCTTHP